MIKVNTKKVLVPIDFSLTAMRAIKHAAFIVKSTKGELLLLHVQKKSDQYSVAFAAGTEKSVAINIVSMFFISKLGHTTNLLIDLT